MSREPFLELRKNWKIYDLWKKGKKTQEYYKYVMSLRREEIRRAKAQLKVSLTTAVKGNKTFL